MIDHFYEIFKQRFVIYLIRFHWTTSIIFDFANSSPRVAQGRSFSMEYCQQIAQGRVYTGKESISFLNLLPNEHPLNALYTGQQALSNGLVDEMGT